MLAVGRHRQLVYRVGVPTIDIWDPILVLVVVIAVGAALPLEGVDERPVDVVKPDLSLVVAHANADHKVRRGQRRDAVQIGAYLGRALEGAVERPQLGGSVG